MQFIKKSRVNVIPAGLESDEEYDEFGEFQEKKVYNIVPKVEDFQLTLQEACMTDNVPEIIRALNSQSLDINCYLNNNWTALMFAAFYGSLDAITYLLQNGADPTIDFDCHNVIMCVCNCKSINCNELILLKCLKLLLSFGNININSKDVTGMTALMFACSNGRLKLVEYLIDYGADIEMIDNQFGETALFFAVRFNHVNVVKFLLSRGANKDATDKKHQTICRIVENKYLINISNLLNSDHEDAQSKEYIFEQQTSWNKVLNELENGFPLDVKSFLCTLSMDVYVNKLISNKITFKQLLTGNIDNFANMGITLTPHQKLLVTALKCFHIQPWSNHSLTIKKNQINAEIIAQTIAVIARQLHVLDASLIYLGTQSHGLNQQKGQENMNNLMKIRLTKEKIFKLLSDKQVRISRTDYIGPCKLKIKNKKNINDIVFFATNIILVLLHVV